MQILDKYSTYNLSFGIWMTTRRDKFTFLHNIKKNMTKLKTFYIRHITWSWKTEEKKQQLLIQVIIYTTHK